MKLDIQEIFSPPYVGSTKWSNEVEYLDRQYRLLREDFLRPLRTSLELILKGKTKSDHLIDYGKVSMISRKIEHKIIYKIRLNENKQDLENSSKLLIGSLIILCDNSANMMFGVVIEKNIEELMSGIIGVELINDSGVGVSSTTVFTMLEYTVYYEAYKHTLANLLQLRSVPFPHIVVKESSQIRGGLTKKNWNMGKFCEINQNVPVSY